jgi:hypothetical protein
VSEGSRLAGEDVALTAAEALEAVRSRGYEVATGRDVSNRFRRVVLGELDPVNELEASEFPDVVRAVVERRDPGMTRPLDELSDVVALMVPVRDPSGRVVLSVGIIGFSGDEEPDRIAECLRRLEGAASRASDLLAAPPPA